MLLKLSRFVPVPMFTHYRPTKGGAKMACFWIQFRGRALFARHWMRST